MLNRVLLIGLVSDEPQIFNFPHGGRVANFVMTTSESWMDKASGKRKEKREFHRIAVFPEQLIDVVQSQVRKGMQVQIEGQLETRKYTAADGTEKKTTDVTLRPYKGSLTVLSGAQSGQDSQPQPRGIGAYAPNKTLHKPTNQTALPLDNARGGFQALDELLGDDLPF